MEATAEAIGASRTAPMAHPDAELGEVREELEAAYNAEPIAIGLNPKYMGGRCRATR